MAGGISAGTAAALAAIVAGSYMQYDASRDASKRQAREIQRSLEAQRLLQMEAEQKAISTAKDFKEEDRTKAQDQIAQTIEQELIAPVSESQAIRSAEQTTQGDVSSDYTAAKATSELETMRQAQNLAKLLGKTTSASRLRMGEGIRMMDAGQGIDQIGSFSRGQAGADQIAVNQAGQVDAGKVFAGQVLSAAGSAGLSAGASSAGTAGTYGTNAGSQQTSMLAAQDAGMRSTSNPWLMAFATNGTRRQ